MKSSLLALCALASLVLAPRPASALGSCYEVCKPSVSCATPCMDPFRPYLGPLACGAGFPCSRSASDGDQDAVLSDDRADLRDPVQTECDNGRPDVWDSSTLDVTVLGQDSRNK